MKAVVLTKKAMILEYVEVVRFEIEGGKKKKISASNDELVQKIWDRLMGEAMNFSTEKELRRHLESVTREMLWLEANTEESDEIIRRLKSGDPSFAKSFFYDTDPKGCNISRFRSKILSQIKRTYGVEVTVDEFGTLLYTFLWNEGSWSVLDKYSRKSSFFAWLAEVARHELRRYLEKMGLVPPCRERTVGNTRLLGMSDLQRPGQGVVYQTQDHVRLSFGYEIVARSFFSGHPEEAIADVVQFPVCPGDRILLCSDGVHKSMEPEDLEARMMEEKSLEEILHGFDLSCWKYGDDNYTAILMEVE